MAKDKTQEEGGGVLEKVLKKAIRNIKVNANKGIKMRVKTGQLDGCTTQQI